MTRLDSKSRFNLFINRANQRPYKYLYKILPRSLRKKLQKLADLSQQKHTAKAWQEVITLYSEGNIEPISIKAKKNLEGKKIIWQYWGQGWKYEKLPLTVKLCYQSVDRYKDNYQVIRLDDNNINEYLEFPEFISEKRRNPEFKHVFYSDILRLALINAYGGIWLDATIFLTANIEEIFEGESSLFLFHRSNNAIEKEKWNNFNPDYFSWDKNHRANVLSSIIFSRTNSPLISDWLKLTLYYWKTQESIPHYFFFQILFNELINTNWKNYTFNKKDDTLPHLLQINLNNPFDEMKFKDILNKTNIHKLTYTKDIIPNSFFEHLLNSYQI